MEQNIITIDMTELKVIVTFTFKDNKILGECFVKAIKEYCEEDNVIPIDQSTYGVREKVLTQDQLISILYKAEASAGKPKQGDKVCLITAEDKGCLLMEEIPVEQN